MPISQQWILRFIWEYFTIISTKSQYLYLRKGIKMAVEEATIKEKLIEYILNLTDEEADTIIAFLKEKEQP